jgi:hypothetical protein
MIFNAIADIIVWVLACQGILHQLHYLDDLVHLILNSQQGQEYWAIALQTLKKLRVPVAAHKPKAPQQH